MAQAVERMDCVTPRIYEAISGVMADIDAVGKNQRNKQQGFMYRGIDDVMNALAPALVKNKVFIVPEVTNEERSERTTANGGVLFYSRLHVTYRFYTTDGSSITAKVIGEAMDSGDKATNKAMSVAYKYAAFQVFNIPTEEMKDPDAECHNLAPEQQEQQQEVVYVDAVKIKVLKNKMQQKGVTDKQMLERYNVNKFEELTVIDFMKAMQALEKTPDKESKQSNLDL